METKDIVYIALFAALTAALGLFPPITLPVTGVPITAQSIGPMLAGSILGAKRGGLSQVLLLVLVAVGLPLLSGGRGGFGVFLGPTGGFAIAWAVSAFTIGYLTERFWRRLSVWKYMIINVVGGIGVSYILGIPWVAFVVELSLWQAFVSSMIFLPGDLLKVVLASIIAIAVKRSYPIIEKSA